MNYKLIMLPNPILATNNPPYKEGDTFITKDGDIHKNYGYNYGDLKIIAGIEGLPKLDLSAIAEEIGLVDVEKKSWEMVNQMSKLEGHYEKIAASWGYINGFKAAQSLNEKKYTNEHMLVIRNRIVSMLPVGEVTAWDMIKAVKEFTNWLDEYVESLSKPKEYNVEYTQEEDAIKVTKILTKHNF